nr:DUF2062 domain-containing protein [Paracoccus sp. Z118]
MACNGPRRRVETVFKRRPRSYGQIVSDSVWPRGGWSRAAIYLAHRVRRLPDQPQRIGRGLGAGTFVNFTPFFGAHVLLAVAIAGFIRGNLLAAVLGTFFGNPVTMPLIAVLSVSLGRWMLGVEGTMSPGAILGEFTAAGGQLWQNILAIFTDAPVHWDRLAAFYDSIFLPYLVGGFIPGIIAGVTVHQIAVPVIRAYHKRRAAKMQKRINQLRERPRR